MNIQIDKSIRTAAYKQLAEQIEEQILHGILKPGQKLLTERELEKETGLSRGTIKSAYRELQKIGKIVTIQGSGSYVAKYSREEARRLAQEATEHLFEQMDSLGITAPESEQIFTQLLNKRLLESSKVHVAWIDCCEECLDAIRKQLQNKKEIILDTMTPADFHRNISRIKEEADLIVTASELFDEVSFAIPGQAEGIEKVMLDLNMSSTIEIVRIPSDCHIALWSGSYAFMDIMLEILVNFDNLKQITTYIGQESLEDMKAALSKNDVLLIPPVYSSDDYPEAATIIQQYRSSGKRVIPFDYQLNSGSLVHFEDRVLDVYQRKNKY